MNRSEIKTMEKALKRLRNLAYQNRYAGLMEDYKLAQDALDALERIEQPELFGETDADAG